MADLIYRDAVRKAMRDCETVTHSIGYSDMIAILDDAPAVNRWISVEDDLPEYGEYVLFIRKNCGVYVGYYDGKNTWNTDYQWFCGENVTHWMPLPEPPESEVQNDE